MTIRIGIGALVVAAGVAAVWVGFGRGGMNGEYDEVGGPGKLVFRGGRVYVAAPLGVTLVAPYELDGDRLIIKGGGGTQVYLRRGDTLDAGMGMKFIKRAETRNHAAAEE